MGSYANEQVSLFKVLIRKQVHSDNDVSEVDILGRFGTF